MDFKNRLKNCRNKKGWTQEEISKLLKIKRPRYAKYETGENQPDYGVLVKLADLFGVSTDYLLGRDHDKAYDPPDEISSLISLNNHLKSMNLNNKELFNIEKWLYLNRDDVEEIKNHMNWIAYKAKDRRK